MAALLEMKVEMKGIWVLRKACLLSIEILHQVILYQVNSNFTSSNLHQINSNLHQVILHQVSSTFTSSCSKVMSIHAVDPWPVFSSAVLATYGSFQLSKTNLVCYNHYISIFNIRVMFTWQVEYVSL